MDARRGEWLGSIIIAAPLSRWLLVMLALALVVAIALLLCLGHYTLRETVTGQVVPSAGLLHVYAPSAGTLASLHVRDGQVVRKGDLLLELSSAADSAALGDTHALVGQQLAAQRAGLQADLRNQQQLSQQQADGLRSTMALLRGQLAQITGQLAQKQITSNQQLLTRIQPQGAKGFVSALQIRQQAAVLDAQAQYKALVRKQLDARQHLDSFRRQLAQLLLDAVAKRNDIERQLAIVARSMAQNEMQRAIARALRRRGLYRVALNCAYNSSIRSRCSATVAGIRASRSRHASTQRRSAVGPTPII